VKLTYEQSQPTMNSNAYWVDSPFPGRICIVPRPRGGDWLDDEIAQFKALDLSLLVSLLEHDEAIELGLAEEASLATSVGIDFHSFPIPDRQVPPFKEFQHFAETISAALQEGRYVGVHCRASIGRASLLVAAVLVLSGSQPDIAWSQIEKARGVPVPDTPEQRAWLTRFALSLDRS
jgi:protein-tyrosine phosphatase